MKKRPLILMKDYAIIVLSNGNHSFISLEDVAELQWHNWYEGKNGYAASRIDGRIQTLHRFIMNPQRCLVVDHIDRNPLNNRRENLRIVTQVENGLNSITSDRSLGVSIDRTHNTWKAYYHNGKHRINVGTYKTKEQAIIARVTAVEAFRKESKAGEELE